MQIEIDQSGKIEETNKDTIIAFSNGIKQSVRIHRRTKRRLQETFRTYGKPRLFRFRVFACGVYILIKNYLSKINQIVIDTEYIGNEKLIKEMIIEIANSEPIKNDLRQKIVFKRIGKNSSAHILALSVSRKNIKADKVIGYDELVKIAIKKSR